MVGVFPRDNGTYKEAAIIVEPLKNRAVDKNRLLKEVKALSAASEVTRKVSHFMVHQNFPVDIRHNAKIFREKLAVWAQKEISPQT